MFELALTLPWDKPKSRSGRPIKRSVCWLTDPAFSFPYSYANLKFKPNDFPAWFVIFQKLVFDAAGVNNLEFNSCNVNYYHDGSEYVDWHADDEPLFGIGMRVRGDGVSGWAEGYWGTLHRFIKAE